LAGGRENGTVEYEPVIGLEVHAQLKTASKIFCRCATRFGDPPNTNTCPVCLGMPGVLPVLNRRVVEFALKAALATGCTVNRRSIFARKNYFYPDLPKGYQISQFEEPIAEHGRVPIEPGGAPMQIGLTRIHMEEDAGKLVHEGMHDSESSSYVDFNRSGVPLIEIVSEPDIRTSEQAYLYLTRLRSILLYLEICDGNMEEGSLRCDANISLRPVGTESLGTKTEIKNLNSFRNVQRALEYEIRRQSALLKDGREVAQETRLWNAAEGRTDPMRSKEEAMDYRYFPEPDIPPLVLEESWLEEVKRTLPELPAARKARYVREWSLPEQDAQFFTLDPATAAYLERAVEGSGNARASANWVQTELMGRLNEAKKTIEESPVAPEALADLVKLIDAGTISGKIAKTVFEEMFDNGGDPGIIVKEKGLVQITDESEIVALVEEVVSGNPEQVKQYRGGKKATLGWFVGRVMKVSGGRANPKLVNKLLQEKLG
jgi:aspartyl-tRNA(Asn)/glutamyl-tRNA(Gln) amidotransferase subunit B